MWYRNWKPDWTWDGWKNSPCYPGQKEAKRDWQPFCCSCGKQDKVRVMVAALNASGKPESYKAQCSCGTWETDKPIEELFDA